MTTKKQSVTKVPSAKTATPKTAAPKAEKTTPAKPSTAKTPTARAKQTPPAKQTTKKTTPLATAPVRVAKPGTKTTSVSRSSAEAKPTLTTNRKAEPSNRSATPRKPVTHEQIAKVAYQLSLQNQAASPEENWLQAEAKLRK